LPPLSQGILAALEAGSWFAALPKPVRDDVVTRLRVRTVVADERIFSRNESPEEIYVVLEGKVRVSGVSREGRETVLDFYGRGAWIGEVSPLAGRVRRHDAHAAGDALVAQLSLGDLEDLLDRHPPFGRALLRLEAERLLIVLDALEVYSALTMEQRLAARLLMLARDHGLTTARGVEVALDLSHETLAQLVGSSRQRVNHLLNRWKRAGMIDHHYGRIVVLDAARLESLVQA
jgi:CRP-like cAMP-binding protein